MEILIGVAALIILLILIICIGYVKAPPDTAYMISGFRKPRILIGKAGIRIPFLERLDKLSLKMFSVDVKTTDFVPNAEYINVKVDATVKIRIGQSEEMMSLASKFFLNESEDMIIRRVQDTLEGNMREIVGQMKLEEMVTDRKAFGERVQENAIPDLQKMGLEMISFNVQSFSDQNNVIEDLGIDNISQIKKGAAVAKAQADRDIAIAQAQAAKEANDAKVQSEMEIAEKQTSLAIRQAELKQQSDVKKAEADAAYSIQEQAQRKTIEVASANADIARAERTAELKAKEVDVTKQTLDAEIRAKADAQRYAAEQEAEAELFRRTKEAEAVQKIIDTSTMELPDAMIDTQVNSMINEFAQRMASQGLTLDQYMQFSGVTMDKLKEQVRPEAVTRIKSSLVLEQIAKEENIEISDDEVAEEIEKMAKAYGMEADKLKEYMGDSEKESMKRDLAIQKAVDLIMENVKERAKAKSKKEKEAEAAESEE